MTPTPISRGPFAVSDLPAHALVLLVGTSGSGKSTLARHVFAETQVLSSDRLRGWISDDESDQSVSSQAFEVLGLLVRHRLAIGRTTVVDATNVSRSSRAEFLGVARAAGRPAVAVVLDVSVEECVARDAARADRRVGRAIIESQRRTLDASISDIALEGFDEIRVMN
ncbi:MAG: AAA family ATPase [Blastocatellia bacterium]|nr:AAA family ATPase [Blastocatellia bacterium]